MPHAISKTELHYQHTPQLTLKDQRMISHLQIALGTSYIQFKTYVVDTTLESVMSWNGWSFVSWSECG